MDVEMGRGERALVVVIVVGFLLAALSSWVRGDGLEVEDGAASHRVESFVHILAGVVDGEWTHTSRGGVHCFQAGPPPPGAHPDSIYFYPRKPRWVAWVGIGPPIPWATDHGLEPLGWIHGSATPGYVAMRRTDEGEWRYSVAFAYLRHDGTWDQTWDWRLRQE